jgi:hypothetical protein
MDRREESSSGSDFNTPGDGDSLNVVLLVAHRPYRRTPTAEGLPASCCAAQHGPVGDSTSDITALGVLRPCRRRRPAVAKGRPLKLALSSSGMVHIPDGFAKSKTNFAKTPRPPAGAELSRMWSSDFDFRKNFPQPRSVCK